MKAPAASWSDLQRLRERLLAEIDVRLAANPGDVELLFGRACALDELARSEDAKNAYLAVLAREPRHAGATNNLGILLERFGLHRQAEILFAEAARAHPEDPTAFVNLGNALSNRGELVSAVAAYEAAVRAVPDHAEAHHGLADVLMAAGDSTRARTHYDAAFTGRPLRINPYYGSAPPVRVLGLYSVTDGNVYAKDIVDDRRFLLQKYVAEYDTPETPLPDHDVVFNAVGDAERGAEALQRAVEIVKRSTARVVNDPAAVLATARAANAARLGKIPGVLAPRMAAVTRSCLPENRPPFPFLLRSPGYHNGRFFERVDDEATLAAVLEYLPGDELIVIEYLDARGEDGRFRKYRVMIVGGKLYPLHAAVSANWNLRFAESDALHDVTAREEDRRFLEEMPGVLGSRAIRALEGIRDALGLDYAGVDFGLDARGNVLLFEANATMRVPHPDRDERWPYRRGALRQIYDAFARMLAGGNGR